jgi:cytochrome c-type biogenesis protein CcmH/NrfF
MGDRPRDPRAHRVPGGARLRLGAGSALRFAALALLLASAGGAAAQAVSDTDIARRAHGISSDIMSPYCPGRTLADCPSPSAAAVRSEVRELLAAGATDGEVLQRLEARFGDAISGVPRSVWGWALPVVLLALGLAGLALALRRLSHSKRPEAVAVDPDLEADVDRELRDLGL